MGLAKQKYSVAPPREIMHLIPEFLERRNIELALSVEALARNDIKQVIYLNHQLEGCALSYGFEYLDQMSKEISKHYQNPVELTRLFDEMRDYLANVEVK